MKRCKDCGQTKPLTEFYKHPKMADGHVNGCKACKRAYALIHRVENIDTIREYDRERSHTSARRKHIAFNSRRWRAENPEKYHAHLKVNNAVRDGRLEKPNRCTRCGRRSSIIHGHHADYSKPLDVEWLCPVCHGSELSIA